MIFKSRKTTRIPEIPVHEAIFFNMKNHEDQVALIDGDTDKSYTYKQLAEAVTSVASALTKQGIKKGDVVAYYGPNSVELSIGILGCFCIGAVVTGVNFNYTAYELQHQVTDCRVKGIFTISSNLQKVKEVEKHYKIQTIITVDNKVPGYLFFADLLKDDGSSYPHGLSFNVYEDLAAILYSSGTTGLPKGVMLTHLNIVADIIQCIIGEVLPKSKPGVPGAAAIGLVPMFHVYGIVLLCVILVCGKTFISVPGFIPERFLGIIQKYKISKLHLVPPMLLFLAKSPLVDKYDVSSVEEVFCGAAPLTQDLEKEFLARFNMKMIIQGYGLTETTGAATIGLPEYAKFGSSGNLTANSLGKIVAVSGNRELSVGEEGEICLKGPQVMKGYLNRPEATRDMIDEEGWLHSGDLGYFDKDGVLFVTGRIKELIKHKGFQVAPAEVEGLIMSHPGVDDAAVIGIPDEAAGELPRAFVVRKPQSKVTAEEIYSFVKERLSRHKWLSGGVQFVEGIPKTASGKIVRREVRKMLNTSKL